MSGYAKVYNVKKNKELRYATDLEQYDFLPYFVIKNNNKKFTLHVEAGQYLFFFVSYDLTPEEFQEANTLWNSLKIEGNILIEKQITTLLENKKFIGPKKDILEVLNAIKI